METAPYGKGLYGVSEMLTEAFLGLIDAGILTRAVDGVVMHGAFFLGPKSFYRALREMTPATGPLEVQTVNCWPSRICTSQPPIGWMYR